MNERFNAVLHLGDQYNFDLLDEFGNVCIAAGTQITEQVIEELHALGAQKLYVGPTVAESDELAGADLPAQYSSSHQNYLANLATDGADIMASVTQRLHAGERIDGNDIDFIVEGYQKIVTEDADVVLAQVLADAESSALPIRSLRMSAISMVAAYKLGYPADQRHQVGRAALLHDVSLPDDWPSQLGELKRFSEGKVSAGGSLTIAEFERQLDAYQTHPFRSADTLRAGLPNVTDLELTIVRQVHEQCDGTGFPRRHRGHLLHRLSRLVNVVDAFLTLTDPLHPNGGYIASDAIAYLVAHALYGTFDRDCVQALVRSTAIYPVGSKVLLSDNSTGTVLRSCNDKYLQPIVRIDAPDGETLDLTRSDMQIVQPHSVGGRRITKNRMHSALWRTV
ncbi:MAG TPA: hypothetical protein DDW52_07470 [Planctomycetaceae bacterium]|nr:hypothetical protein [Planctomycetaceae bacterium]